MGGYKPKLSDENAMVVPDLESPRVPNSIINANLNKPYKPVASTSFYAAPPPKKIASKIVIGEKSAKDREAWGGAVFNPEAKDAVVMQRPSKEEAKKR